MKKLLLVIGIIIFSFSLGFAACNQVKDSKTINQVQENDYPKLWADLPYGALLDSWGSGTKSCASWVSWRAWQDLRYKVDRWGEAKFWPEKAQSVGLTVDLKPAVGSAMVNTHYYPGHIMWVESINADGTVHISEYNKDGDGKYNERDASTELMVFIHFPKIDRGY